MSRCRATGLLPLLAFLVASCRGAVPEDVVGSPGAPEDWLCEPAPDGGWACTRGADNAEANTAARRPPPSSSAITPAEPLENAGRPPALPTGQSATSAIGLIDAPATHYAVQLIALGSEQALRDFVAQRQLAGMKQVRVESRGRLHFALLAGVHPTRAAAERAVAAMAPALQALGPWIRSVGNLRQAMARADRLAEAMP